MIPRYFYVLLCIMIFPSLGIAGDKGNVKLYFSHKYEDPCDGVKVTNRHLQIVTPDSALRELFAGPNKEEKARGFYSSFHWKTDLAGNGVMLRPLKDYYKKVVVKKDGTALVYFSDIGESDEVMLYLDSAACAQRSIKNPIERTLLQFPAIKRVEYVVNGVLVEGWDA